MSSPADPALDWRQGDCVLGTQDFIYRILATMPLAKASMDAVAEDPLAEFVAQPVEGLMVVSQSCDIVRAAKGRPFVEVVPLVQLPDLEFREVILGARPQYATVPSLHADKLAADLDRVMTVEKTLLSTWARHPGCSGDSDRRLLGKQLARKRYRAALPDEFNPWFKPLRNRLSRLADANSADALVFSELEEIRIQATPAWGAAQINIFIWFILKDEAPNRDRSEVLDAWLAKIPPRSPFISCDGRMAFYSDMTASEYIDSDSLDLDYMSPEEPEAT
jgi:hypothetical protein